MTHELNNYAPVTIMEQDLIYNIKKNDSQDVRKSRKRM